MAVPLNQPEDLLAISHISIISNPTLRLEMEAIDSDSDMYVYIAEMKCDKMKFHTEQTKKLEEL